MCSPTLVNEEGEYGIARLAGYPIVASEHMVFPTVEGWEPNGSWTCGSMSGTVTSGRSIRTGKPVSMSVTWRRELQRADAGAAIAFRARAADGPVIVMGDLNADVAHVASDALGFMSDTCAEQVRAGATFPASPVEAPARRIDGIFLSGEWLVRDTTMMVSEETKVASDHYPVVAD